MKFVENKTLPFVDFKDVPVGTLFRIAAGESDVLEAVFLKLNDPNEYSAQFHSVFDFEDNNTGWLKATTKCRTYSNSEIHLKVSPND